MMQKPLLFQSNNGSKRMEYIDVPFKGEILEIITGPEMSQEEYEDLQTYLNAKNSEIVLKKSAIKLRGM